MICFKMVPEKYDIVAAFNVDEQKIENTISVEGELEITGLYNYSNLNLIKDGKEVVLPKLTSIRIYSFKKGTKITNGEVSYIEEYKNEVSAKSEPAQFYISLGVTDKQFNILMKLALCPMAQLTIKMWLRGISINGEVSSNWYGDHVTWDVGKKHTVTLERYYFENTLIKSEILKVNSQNDMLKDFKLSTDYVYRHINLLPEGTYKNITTIITNEAIENIEKTNTVSEFVLNEENLNNVLFSIDRLNSAINRYRKTSPENKETDFILEDLRLWGSEFNKPWVKKINQSSISHLDEIITEYLSQGWFSSPTFEWIIINSYLHYWILEKREELIVNHGLTRSLLAKCTTAYQYILKSFTLNTILFSLKYLFPAYIIVYFFNMRESSVLSTFIVLFIFVKLFSWFDFFGYRKSRKENLDALNEMIKLKHYVSENSWAPSQVMKKIDAIEHKINLFTLPSLMAKIIKRDPYIFNASSNYKRTWKEGNTFFIEY